MSGLFPPVIIPSTLPVTALHIQDIKANGVNGGASVANVWIARNLTTIVSNSIDGASLANNKITLPSGDYSVVCNSPYYIVGVATRLRDVTNGVTLLAGSNSWGSAAAQLQSNLIGLFSLISETDIELQYFAAQVNANGLGPNSGVGGGLSNIYSNVLITKIG